ncbi:peptidoglycan-binding protein [Nonomuraea sp. B12E4]|uniref:peptidoglycan-binding protein n=1 Tax=Nonomuraea sp. B12E4 TaxID=3153564 RepID=UPI00325F2909
MLEIAEGPDLDVTVAQRSRPRSSPPLPMIRPGDDSHDVKTVRGCLFARGRVPPAAYAATETGLAGWLESTVCDPGLIELVRTFQRAEGLGEDGIVGPKTWPPLLRV